MVDEPLASGVAEGPGNILANAQRARESTSEQVSEAGRHFKETIRAARKSDSVWEFLEDRTRAKPLTMLGLAFIAGAIFVRRR